MADLEKRLFKHLDGFLQRREAANVQQDARIQTLCDGVYHLAEDIGTALGEVQKKAADEAATLRREIDGLRSEVVSLRASRAPQKASRIDRAPFVALMDVDDDPDAVRN